MHPFCLKPAKLYRLQTVAQKIKINFTLRANSILYRSLIDKNNEIDQQDRTKKYIF